MRRNITSPVNGLSRTLLRFQYGLIAALVGTGIIGSTTELGGQLSNTVFNVVRGLEGEVVGGNAGITFDGVTGSWGQFENATGSGMRASGFEDWESTGAGRYDIAENGFSGITFDGGDYWVDLQADTSANSGLRRTLDFSQPGGTYEFSFQATNQREGRQTTMDVIFGGEVIDTITTNGGVIESYSYNLVEGSGNGLNQLEVLETTGRVDGSHGTVLGNIVIK